jgi:hypothetical protein
MSELAGLLDANLSRDAPRVLSVRAIMDLSLPTSELAELMAGTSDKSSRAYRSARRQAERLRKKPSTRIRETTRRRVQGVSRQRSARLAAFRAHGGDMRVLIVNNMSEVNVREEWLPPGGWVHLPARTMRSVIRYWGEGDHELAAGYLYGAFLERYAVPNIDEWQDSTEVIGLELEPTR